MSCEPVSSLNESVHRSAFLADDKMRIGERATVEQVRRDHGVEPFERLPVDVLVGEQSPVERSVVGRVQPNDDHVYVRLAASVRSPREGPMRECDLQAAVVKQQRPELRHLLALRDGVGRHETDPRRCSTGRLRPSHVVPGTDKPRGYVVERPAAAAERCDAPHLRTLLGRLELGPAKRRIAEHVRALVGRQHVGPVDLQRVGVADVRRLLDRDPRVRLTELQAQPVVHDVVHHPQRGRRDAGRKLADLDAVELVDLDDGPDGERQLRGCSPGSSRLVDLRDRWLNLPERGEWVDEPVPGIRSDRCPATRTR